MIKCVIVRAHNPEDQIKSVLAIVDQLLASEKEEVFDMTEVEWVTPFSALILANAIMSRKAKTAILAPKDLSVKTYLETIGFPLGKNTQGNTYCPLRHFTTNPQKAVDAIYAVINKNYPEEVQGNVAGYIFSELSDNISEHSQFHNATMLAQYFPKTGEIDMGFIDDGISIPGSYEQHGRDVPSDANAIEQAVQGISTKEGWSRGHGLPSCKGITKDLLKGEFYIISRQGVLVHRSGASNIYNLESKGLRGTVVYLRFSKPAQTPNVTAYLSKEEYRE